MQIGDTKYNLIASGSARNLTVRKAYDDNREVSGTANTYNKDGIVPILFGTSNIVPFLQQQVVPTISFNKAKAIYSVALVLGYSDITVGNIKLGNDPLSSVGAILYSEQLNGATLPDNEQLTTFNQTLSYNEDSAFHRSTNIIATSKDNCNKIRILLHFPNGLYKDVLEPNSYTVQISYKKHNQTDANYTNLPGYAIDNTFTETNKSAFYKEIAATLPEGRYNVRLQVLTKQNTQDIEGYGEHGEPVLWAVCFGYSTPAVSAIVKDAVSRYELEFVLPNNIQETADSISMTAQKKWKYWNGSSWVADTSAGITLSGGVPVGGNPASAILYALTSTDTLGKRAMTESEIDLDSLASLYTYASSNGLEYNKYLTDIRTAEEQLYKICLAAEAYPYVNDAGKISFVTDVAKSVSFVVCPRLVLKNTMRVNLLRRDDIHYDVASVSFIDKDIDGNTNTGIVWYDQNNQGQAIDSLNYKAITLDSGTFDGITKREQIWRAARKYLIANNDTTFNCSFSLDVRGNLINLMDKIAIQHPDFNNYCISGNALGIEGFTITVDADVPTAIDASTGFTNRDMALPQTTIMLMSAMGCQILDIVSISGTTVTVSAAITVFDATGDNFYSIGGIPVYAKVTEITNDSKSNVTVTCVDYLDAYYAVNSETVPAFTEYDKNEVIVPTGLTCDYSVGNPFKVPLGHTGAVLIYPQPNGAKYLQLSASTASSYISVDASVTVVNIEANSVGTATVNVTDNYGNSLSFPVQVYIPVTSVSLSSAASTLDYQETTTVTATVLPSNATDKNISWYNNDTSAVGLTDISGNYEDTSDLVATAVAISNGQSRIYVKTSDGAYLDWVDIAVNITPDSVSIEDVVIQTGNYIQINPTIIPSGVASAYGTWTILSGSDYISFESYTAPATYLVIRGVSAGGAVVRFTASNGVYTDFNVTVANALTGITLSGNLLQMDAELASNGRKVTYAANAGALVSKVDWTVTAEIDGQEGCINVSEQLTNGVLVTPSSSNIDTFILGSTVSSTYHSVTLVATATDYFGNVATASTPATVFQHFNSLNVELKEQTTITPLVNTLSWRIDWSPTNANGEGWVVGAGIPSIVYNLAYEDGTAIVSGWTLGVTTSVTWLASKSDQAVIYKMWSHFNYNHTDANGAYDRRDNPDITITVNRLNVLDEITTSTTTSTIYADTPDYYTYPDKTLVIANFTDDAGVSWVNWYSTDASVAIPTAAGYVNGTYSPFQDNATSVLAKGGGTCDIYCVVRYRDGTYVTSSSTTITVKQGITEIVAPIYYTTAYETVASWSSSTSYAIDDIVEYGGAYYISLLSSNTAPLDDISAWELVTRPVDLANSNVTVAVNSIAPVDFDGVFDIYIYKSNVLVAEQVNIASISTFNFSYTSLGITKLSDLDYISMRLVRHF